MKGHCLCGAVQFEGVAAKEVGVCHCRMCRRWAGGPFVSVHCTEATFSGMEHIGVYASSAWAERGFCTKCGTHLYYKLLPTGEYYLPAGMLETDDFEFTTQVYIDCKPDYYDFANQTQMVTEQQIVAQFMPESGDQPS